MCIFKYKAVLSYMKTVNNDFSCFQRLCRMETLVLSVQSFPSALEWKEEPSQLDAHLLCLEAGSSSVKKNVKKEIFSLKQQMIQPRVADIVLNI